MDVVEISLSFIDELGTFDYQYLPILAYLWLQIHLFDREREDEDEDSTYFTNIIRSGRVHFLFNLSGEISWNVNSLSKYLNNNNN